MTDSTPGNSDATPQTLTFEPFTICAALGVILIAAATLLAIKDLSDGGDYAFWFALTDFASTAAVGVLVLVCARRLKAAPWSEGLMRVLPALGIASILASVALALKDATDEFNDRLWDPLEDLVIYVPVALGVLLFLSAVTRGDRVLGQPSQWGRLVGAVVIAGALAVSLNRASDLDQNEFWGFLSTFAAAAGLGLLLIGASLEPTGSAAPVTRSNGLPLLNDPRMGNWTAFGAVAVVAAGVALGLKTLDEASSDGFWLLLQIVAFHAGLGIAIFIAAGTRLGAILEPAHPSLRWAAAAAIGVTFVAGFKFAADADSDQFWVFLNDAIVLAAPSALALAMWEAHQRLVPLRVVEGSSE